ncbi:MAG: ATP-binding protein [Desulfosporosinus sp.]|nr:ATP-binding protein [Desulfosporosinus sp.]
MKMLYTEVFKIIEGGLDKNKDKVQKYSALLAEKLKDDGENQLAERVLKLLQKRSIHPVYLDEFCIKPVDQDSRLDMVDIYFARDTECTQQIILPDITERKIKQFVDVSQNRNKLLAAGIESLDSLLLYGPPGCGKTSVARYVSGELQLPLVTARLDGLVSSLLGSTAKNIRKVFDYAKERPCILFLDEFDAIAKARGDQHEVGELKRVVNSLLQNIDEFLGSGTNILIAATNHENLLDPAVWRRFNSVIEVPKPSEGEIDNLVRIFISPMKFDFTDSKRMEKIVDLLVGLSPSDIKTICFNAKRSAVLNNNDFVSLGSFLYEFQLFNNSSGHSTLEIVKSLYQNGVSQDQIHKVLDISIRQVRKLLQEDGDDKEHG